MSYDLKYRFLNVDTFNKKSAETFHAMEKFEPMVWVSAFLNLSLSLIFINPINHQAALYDKWTSRASGEKNNWAKRSPISLHQRPRLTKLPFVRVQLSFTWRTRRLILQTSKCLPTWLYNDEKYLQGTTASLSDTVHCQLCMLNYRFVSEGSFCNVLEMFYTQFLFINNINWYKMSLL